MLKLVTWQAETPNQLPLTFAQEAAEINRIMGKDLTEVQSRKIKKF